MLRGRIFIKKNHHGIDVLVVTWQIWRATVASSKLCQQEMNKKLVCFESNKASTVISWHILQREEVGSPSLFAKRSPASEHVHTHYVIYLIISLLAYLSNGLHSMIAHLGPIPQWLVLICRHHNEKLNKTSWDSCNKNSHMGHWCNSVSYIQILAKQTNQLWNLPNRYIKWINCSHG